MLGSDSWRRGRGIGAAMLCGGFALLAGCQHQLVGTWRAASVEMPQGTTAEGKGGVTFAENGTYTAFFNYPRGGGAPDGMFAGVGTWRYDGEHLVLNMGQQNYDAHMPNDDTLIVTYEGRGQSMTGRFERFEP